MLRYQAMALVRKVMQTSCARPRSAHGRTMEKGECVSEEESEDEEEMETGEQRDRLWRMETEDIEEETEEIEKNGDQK